MTQPLVITIPHSLGKAEAARRLKTGVARASVEFEPFIHLAEERWDGDRLLLQLTALKQRVRGAIDVKEEFVRVEVTLPWILASLAKKVHSIVETRGVLMLEKKH